MKKLKEIHFKSIKINHILNDRCDGWLTLTPWLVIIALFASLWVLCFPFVWYFQRTLLCFSRILTLPTLYDSWFITGHQYFLNPTTATLWIRISVLIVRQHHFYQISNNSALRQNFQLVNDVPESIKLYYFHFFTFWTQ